MSKLSIAYITPEFLPVRGGVSVYSINLVKNLLELGLDVHVITPARNSSISAEKDSEYLSKNGNLFVHKLNESTDNFASHVKFQLAVAKALPKLDSTYHFDLIHSNFPSSPELLYLIFRDLNLPVLTTCHGSVSMLRETIYAALGAGNGLDKNLDAAEKTIMRFHYPLRLAERIYLSKVDRVISVSNYMMEWLFKFVPTEDVNLVYHGIDTELFRKNGEPEEATILFVGRFALHKGIHVLLRALPLVFKEIPKAKVLIAGNTDNVSMIQQIRNSIDGKNHEFLGFVENYSDLPNIYSRATIFVSPSFEDLLGFRLLEAMSCGVPVVATKVGGVPEVISDEQNGILVPAGDHQILAEKIALLLNDKSLRAKIRSYARETVEKKFTAKVMSQKTLKIYNELVN